MEIPSYLVFTSSQLSLKALLILSLSRRSVSDILDQVSFRAAAHCYHNTHNLLIGPLCIFLYCRSLNACAMIFRAQANSM